PRVVPPGRGEPDRPHLRRAGERGTRRRGGPGGQGRRRADLLFAPRPDLCPGGGGRAVGPSHRGEVRGAFLREGDRHIGEGDAGPAVPLPERVVSRLPGRPTAPWEEG